MAAMRPLLRVGGGLHRLFVSGDLVGALCLGGSAGSRGVERGILEALTGGRDNGNDVISCKGVFRATDATRCG